MANILVRVSFSAESGFSHPESCPIEEIEYRILSSPYSKQTGMLVGHVGIQSQWLKNLLLPKEIRILARSQVREYALHGQQD
ncbi:MAG: hypothetical protein IH951_10980 [Bacteroidetes bacterium]|nr:hypothetical protein [Bacteroidota bacterium]